jgi:hypothetical protein
MNKKIDIAILSETKKKLKGSKELEHYILNYGAVPQEKRASTGVAIMINKKLTNRIYSYDFINERIVTIRPGMDRAYISIVGTYAAEEGGPKIRRNVMKCYKIYYKI